MKSVSWHWPQLFMVETASPLFSTFTPLASTKAKFGCRLFVDDCGADSVTRAAALMVASAAALANRPTQKVRSLRFTATSSRPT